LLGHPERVVYLDAQVPDGAVELGVPEEELNCPKIAVFL